MLALCMALLQNPEDEKPFEKFYKEYRNIIFTIAKDHLENTQLAEDCVQEVFIRFARNFHTVKEKWNEETILSLIKIVTKNVAIDVFRTNKRHIDHLSDLDITDAPFLSEKDFDICEEILLKDAIDSLPEEIKSVFYLKYVCNYKGNEISKILGISESLVRKRCMLGMQMAKKYIENDD